MKKEKNLFFDILNTVTKCFLVFICILIVYLLCSGIRVVKSGNVAIVLRFGKITGRTRLEQVHEPGLLLAFPEFIDEVVVIPANNVMEQTVNTHFTERTGITGLDGGYLLTGDQSVAVASASVKYKITDPVDYVSHVMAKNTSVDRDETVKALIDSTISSAMLNEAAHIAVDELFTSKKAEFAEAVKTAAAKRLEKLHAGIGIVSLELTQISMPMEVLDWYNKVQSATINAKTMREEAASNAVKQLAEARSEANSVVAQANQYKSKKVADANYEMNEIAGVAKEIEDKVKATEGYESMSDEEKAEVEAKVSEAVKSRIFAEKVKQILNKIGRVRIVEDDGTKIVINP